MVIYDRDLMTMPEEDIMTAQVDYTIVGGRFVYQRQQGLGQKDCPYEAAARPRARAQCKEGPGSTFAPGVLASSDRIPAPQPGLHPMKPRRAMGLPAPILQDTRRTYALGLLYVYTFVDIMTFTWDSVKSRANLQERGFDFEFATLAFEGATLERDDCREEYGERRVVAVGVVGGIHLTIVYTDRTDREGGVVRRIISARRSNRRERQAYLEATEG